MSKEEISEMLIMLSNPTLSPAKHEGWRNAFNEYNEDHPERKFNMGCRPCYYKVLAYLIIKHL